MSEKWGQKGEGIHRYMNVQKGIGIKLSEVRDAEGAQGFLWLEYNEIRAMVPKPKVSTAVSVRRQGKLGVWLEAECPGATVHSYQQAFRHGEGDSLILGMHSSAVTSCCG